MYAFTAKYYKLIFLIIVITNEISFAQLNPNNLVQFSEKDGLPGAPTGQILQDHFGYIWIPTMGGLVKYNGYDFKRFLLNPNDSGAIKSTIIISLFEDSKKNIWIGGPYIEVYNPDKNSFKHFGYESFSGYKVLTRIKSITESSNGRIYFGVTELHFDFDENLSDKITNGLLYYDNKDDRIMKYQSPDSLVIKSVLGLISDPKNNVWILSNSGLFKIDKKNNLTRILDAYNEIIKNRGRYNDLKIDNEGIIWITGYKSKFYSFDPQTKKYNTYSLNGLFKGYHNKLSTYSVAVDKSDNIWLGSAKGLIYYDRKKKKYNIFKNESDRHVDRAAIFGLNFDSFGSLWIGTQSSGLLKYDQRTLFDSYSFNNDKDASLTGGWAGRIIESKEGRIWITTQGIASQNPGIDEFDPTANSIKRYFYRNFIPGTQVWSMYQVSRNKFYLSTNNGTYLFSSKDLSVKKIDLNGVTENIRIDEFYNDSRGNLWLCTNRGIYRKNKDSTKFIHCDLENIDTSGNYKISRAFESKYHGLWFTTDNGLVLYDYKSDKFNRYGFDINSGDVFLSQNINSLYEDNDGIVWVGTWEGGLSRFDFKTKKIKTYTVNDGLPSMSIQGILGDEEDNTLWLSTFNGLVRFDKKSEKFSSFSVSDGIQGQLFAYGSYLKTSGGLFIFGGSNGVTVFNPNEIDRNLIPPKVFLTDLKISNKSILPGTGSILKKPIYETNVINLEHDNNFISLDFIALHYLDPSQNQYKYILENYDKDWRYVGNQHSAYYPNLPPGEYLFRVKASNNHDLWNEQGASLKIIIIPPWWKTWWAYFSYALLFLFALYLLRRYEMNRISYKNQAKLDKAILIEKEETEKIRSGFFANISHEFRTPLTLILGPAEKILSNSSNAINNDAGIIKTNATRLLRLVNQLLDLSKLESGKHSLKASKGNIVAFVRTTALSFESWSELKDITIKISAEKEYIELYFDKDKMTKILSNILSNAFKFTLEEGEITVSIKENISSGLDSEIANNSVDIKIRDTGMGIPQNEIPKLFDRFYQVDSSQTRAYEGTGIGLALTKELVEFHHGKISVESELGKWSEFTISFPLGRDHLKDDEIICDEIEGAEDFSKEAVYETNEIINNSKNDEKYEITYGQNDNSRNIILVIEDNYDMREYIKGLLKDDYLVEEAINGEQGIRKAGKIIPDLIISDMMMPKMDGIELTKIIKNDEKTSHIPVIILTARAGQENKLEGLETGADEYLTKPFDIKELQVRIDNLIKTRKKLQEKFSRGKYISIGNETRLSSLDEKFMNNVIEIIEKNLSDEEFSIESLALEIGMSRSQVHRKIKALTGKSPSVYMRTLRLIRAKEMIEAKIGNISEIAYSVGFSSPAYFTRCFKEEFGHTPSNFNEI